MIMTKADVLAGMEKIKVAVKYKTSEHGKVIDMPYDLGLIPTFMLSTWNSMVGKAWTTRILRNLSSLSNQKQGRG